jgi:hypothetical protein
LITNHRIPADAILVATCEERGLEKVESEYRLGLADPACPVRFIITQKALAEGGDCPFAYILVSMASLSSATAVEQLLGRVLRQPEACHRHARELNQSYAFVGSRHFAETAGTLRDRLVAGAGFERREVSDFVTAAKPDQGRLDLAGHAGRVVMQPVSTRLTEKPDLKTVPKTIRDKVNWDGKRDTLTINALLAEEETDLLNASVKTASASAAIVEAAETSRTSALEIFQTPTELGNRFRIPQLALRVRASDGSEQLRLFDDPEVLDYPWNLSLHDAAPTADDIAALGTGLQVSEGGEIDVDDAESRVSVSDQDPFEFHNQAYAPSRDYDPRTSPYGSFEFRKHFYGRIGDFDSKEEFECACWLDIQAQKGRILFWVRNLVRREGCAFFLQKGDGRFYPDFLCRLPGSEDKPGPTLAVEFKGADRWKASEDDRLIGGLWAGLSEGRCRFVMVKDKRWDWIDPLLS